MTLSLCIVGCGSFARTVVEEVLGVEGVDLLFASRDAGKARAFSEEFGGVGHFGSYEDAARDPRVDAMYFFTPHDLHLDNARLAARHSKHILMEKPIARTIAEAREMISIAAEAGVRLMVAENYRFLPAVEKCKELLADGVIGDLRMVQYQHEGYAEQIAWRTSVESTGGGVFIDGGIHAVNAIVNIGGLPTEVFAAVPPKTLETEGEDGIVVTMRLPGDAVGLLNYSSATPGAGLTRWLNVTGTKGQIRNDPFGTEMTLRTNKGDETIMLRDEGRGSRGIVREFRDAISQSREPVMSGEEGLTDLAVVLAAYRSAESGAPAAVSLD